MVLSGRRRISLASLRQQPTGIADEEIVEAGSAGLIALVGGIAAVAAVGCCQHARGITANRAAALAIGWGAVVALTMFGTGRLMRAALPEPPYVVSWGSAATGFSGEVLNGGIGNLRVPPGPAARGDLAAQLLRRGAPLGVFAVAGEPRPGLVPLISVHDGAGQEVALLAADGSDLLYRGRSLASDLGLRDPVIRAVGVLDSLAVGDTARLATMNTSIGRCFDVATNRYCGLGLTGASGWAFFVDLPARRQGDYSLADAVWLALLILPAGIWAGPKLAALIFVALAWFGIVRLPVDAPVLSVTIVALIGLAAGLAAGMVLRELATRRKRRHEASASGATTRSDPSPP
jgi:hypothetical protein